MKNNIRKKLGLFLVPYIFYLIYIFTLDYNINIYLLLRTYISVVFLFFAEMILLIFPFCLSTFIYGKGILNNDKKKQLKKGKMSLLWILGIFILCVFAFAFSAFFISDSLFIQATDYVYSLFGYSVILSVMLFFKAIYHFIVYDFSKKSNVER